MQRTIDQLLRWATARGIVLDGIDARPLPDCGIGIVATRALEVSRPEARDRGGGGISSLPPNTLWLTARVPFQPNEHVLRVPCALLRSLTTTPEPVVRSLKGASVHAVLAAALCLDDDDDGPWRALLPSRTDVEASLPLCWPPALQRLLPPAARRLRDGQRAKFDRDWALVAAAYPRLDRPGFLRTWLLVNSRSFYHATPETESALPREDRIVLQPVADLFNHASDGACSVAFDYAHFTFTTTRPYAPGDELSICYGPHSDDLLLVEYGFTLGPANPWDETCLDPYLCPYFSADQTRRLRQAGFWGRYMLDARTACFRTQVALRILCLAPVHWLALLDGSRDEDRDQDAADDELLKVLARCQDDIRATIRDIDGSGDDSAARVKTCLRSRWLRIKQLVDAADSRVREKGQE